MSDNKGRVLFIYDDFFLKHDTGQHPENSERLNWINIAIKNSEIKDKLEYIKPVKALREDILRVHKGPYIDRIAENIDEGNRYLDSMDTVISKDSLEAAFLAAGAGITAADEIMKADSQYKTAFCAVRPPGHHACENMAMGFCLFNNVAVTAKYLQHKYGINKILILDWDVHHGNGTEKTFYQDSSVYYISTHQWPHYPGTGSDKDIGVGEGKGFNKNFPMPAGSGDKEYLTVFEQEIIPTIKEFAPEFILISAGFDAHKRDFLSEVGLSGEIYGTFTKMIKEVSDSAQGRIISFLEGGYEPVGLSEGVLYHLREL